jgi:hypothetical protein
MVAGRPACETRLPEDGSLPGVVLVSWGSASWPGIAGRPRMAPRRIRAREAGIPPAQMHEIFARL